MENKQKEMIVRNLRRIADSIEAAPSGEFEFNLKGDRKIRYDDGFVALESEVNPYPPSEHGESSPIATIGELVLKFELPVKG
jgi:hypothetical protein